MHSRCVCKLSGRQVPNTLLACLSDPCPSPTSSCQDNTLPTNLGPTKISDNYVPRVAENPVDQTTRMMDCLATIKAVIAVLQKNSCQIKKEAQSDGSNLHLWVGHVEGIMEQLIQVLNQGKYFWRGGIVFRRQRVRFFCKQEDC